MTHLYLGLALHNHQPIGNYGFVIDQVYRDAYEPLLACLERHPSVRASLHHSGCLFDWIADHHPEYLDRLATIAARGQVELMTGGYYEPILPMIPDTDKLGQIRKLTDFIRERFGQDPDGLWLAERVWEPGLPAVLAQAGVRWTLVDDSHFKMVGLEDNDLTGPYVTEDQGQRLLLYSGSKALRYAIPWKDVDEVISYLRGWASDDAGRILVLGDDGEKFGSWPTTYAHVWEGGWMGRFFQALEENADWLETIPLGEHARRFQPRGLVYLPTASYAEMMEWALPPALAGELHRLRTEAEAQGRDDLVRHLGGGFWRSFLARYPESNQMHKRILRIQPAVPSADSPAREHLWKAECNCPYWHGVFGGLYLRNIRAAVARHLVAAERAAGAAMSGGDVRVEDFDFDGQREVLLQTADLSLMFDPAEGGMLTEWDLRRRDWALLNVVARHREAYHEALLRAPSAVSDEHSLRSIHDQPHAKETGLESALVFDVRRRGGLQETLVAPETTVGEFARNHGAVAPLTPLPFELETAAADAVRLTGWLGPLRVAKAVEAGPGESITVGYVITNSSEEAFRGALLSEWNLSPPQAPLGDDRTHGLQIAQGPIVDLTADAGVTPAVSEATVRGSSGIGLRLRPDRPVDIWHFPVETVSNSEGGLERVLQGVCLAVRLPLDLAPGQSASLALRWDVTEG